MRSTQAHHICYGSNVSTDNLGEPHAHVFRPTSAAVLKRGGGRESSGKWRENFGISSASKPEIRNQKSESNPKSEKSKIES